MDREKKVYRFCNRMYDSKKGYYNGSNDCAITSTSECGNKFYITIKRHSIKPPLRYITIVKDKGLVYSKQGDVLRTVPFVHILEKIEKLKSVKKKLGIIKEIFNFMGFKYRLKDMFDANKILSHDNVNKIYNTQLFKDFIIPEIYNGFYLTYQCKRIYNPDIKVMAKKIFSKVSKYTIKYVYKNYNNPERLLIVYLFKCRRFNNGELINISKIVFDNSRFFQTSYAMGYAMGNVFKHLYNILKYIDKRKLYNYLFKNFNSNNLIIVTDINKMCLKLKENGNNIDIDGYKSIKEIHDDIYHQYRNMNIAKYEFDKVCFDNDSYEYESGSYRIEIPCNTDKLIEYSTKLKNCISSYNRKFHNLNCVLLAVYVDNVLKYNIELVKNDKDNYTLKQFLGIKNNKPDKKDLLVVTNILKDLEIKTKNQPITTNII